MTHIDPYADDEYVAYLERVEYGDGRVCDRGHKPDQHDEDGCMFGWDEVPVPADACDCASEPMTLTNFLLTRFAEDEAVAKRLADTIVSDLRSCDLGSHEPPLGLPSVTMTPDRALDECEAKRRIVEHLRTVAEDHAEHSGWVYFAEQPLKLLAAIYADHPEYREEWKP